ncbi:hypothetical protein GVN18_39270 [Pseudomonas sp. ODNR1LW]|nr:hypothetical protein [Pseudomonas sp. ODNR1LW]
MIPDHNGDVTEMVLRVPADLAERAAAIIGKPFLPKGDTPEGWDCRGCARWCYREWCGIALPDYGDLYESAIVTRAGRAERARLLAEGLAAWRPVPPQAGALAWLTFLGVAGHVGFMISPSLVVHADVGIGTQLLDLTEVGGRYRLAGAFVPAFVTLESA